MAEVEASPVIGYCEQFVLAIIIPLKTTDVRLHVKCLREVNTVTISPTILSNPLKCEYEDWWCHLDLSGLEAYSFVSTI